MSRSYSGPYAFKHGLARHPAYKNWQSMHSRCYNEADRDFYNYGGRGIQVCARWFDVSNFIADMGEKPTGYCVDRINGNRHYMPSNCRWASRKEQSNNTRTNHRLEIEGVSKTISEWSRISGISKSAIWHRLDSGWLPKSAVWTPIDTRKRSKSYQQKT